MYKVPSCILGCLNCTATRSVAMLVIHKLFFFILVTIDETIVNVMNDPKRRAI